MVYGSKEYFNWLRNLKDGDYVLIDGKCDKVYSVGFSIIGTYAMIFSRFVGSSSLMPVKEQLNIVSKEDIVDDFI